MKASWDIFCTVVDNFGDIGVTLRLARQLVAEHHMAVRLWVDDLKAFRMLCPDADPAAERQLYEGVEVRLWPSEWQQVTPADVVIEAFACHLPPAFIDAMQAREPRPLWLNLEYLSAEQWVSASHGLASMLPIDIDKFFFYPGFRDDTGGLLRERGLIEARQLFQRNGTARRDFLAGLGILPEQGARLMSVFCYEHPELGSWLDALRVDTRPVHLLVPEGRVLGDVGRWLDVEALAAGDVHHRDRLTVQVLPFVPQADYDRLLWCCEFNVVRGEDSFVRAQWAGRPLLWHIYEQDDGAHWVKLDAFLALYCAGLSPGATAALTAFWKAWNAGAQMTESWQALGRHRQELDERAERWALERGLQADLTTALVQFYLDWL